MRTINNSVVVVVVGSRAVDAISRAARCSESAAAHVVLLLEAHGGRIMAEQRDQHPATRRSIIQRIN